MAQHTIFLFFVKGPVFVKFTFKFLSTETTFAMPRGWLPTFQVRSFCSQRPWKNESYFDTLRNFCQTEPFPCKCGKNLNIIFNYSVQKVFAQIPSFSLLRPCLLYSLIYGLDGLNPLHTIWI